MRITKDALSHLKVTQPLFEALSEGRHINASQDTDLWGALSGEHFEEYQALFAHLGQRLVRNARGFAYFDVEDSDAKGTRPLALLFLLIFQKQADAGQDLYRFDSWALDGKFLQELREKNQDLLRSEGLESDERWKTVLNRAVHLGFLAREGSSFLPLPATWRFLDLFLELDQERRDKGEDDEAEATTGDEGVEDDVLTVEEEE